MSFYLASKEFSAFIYNFISSGVDVIDDYMSWDIKANCPTGLKLHGPDSVSVSGNVKGHPMRLGEYVLCISLIGEVLGFLNAVDSWETQGCTGLFSQQEKAFAMAAIRNYPNTIYVLEIPYIHLCHNLSKPFAPHFCWGVSAPVINPGPLLATFITPPGAPTGALNVVQPPSAVDTQSSGPVKCECGAEKTRTGHSTWCPKYIK